MFSNHSCESLLFFISADQEEEINPIYISIFWTPVITEFYSQISSFRYFLVLIYQNAKQEGNGYCNYCHTELLVCSEYSVLSIPTQTDSSEYNISYQRRKPDLNREFKNSLL